LIKGDIELALDFGSGAFRDEEELDELFIAFSGKPFLPC